MDEFSNLAQKRITEDRGEPSAITYESTLLKVGSDFWYVLVISFLIATACSACYQIAFGKIARSRLAWIASAICFGLGSVLAVCLMWGADLHISRVIAISIVCGFGGESILSMITRIGLNLVVPGGREALKQAEEEIKKEKRIKKTDE